MADQSSIDRRFMRRALHEATKGLGYTSPNPAVGAVLVKNGAIVATGYHRRAGLPHAEIEAIAATSDPSRCRGATLYVTLEPCSTTGRTPPCTTAIINANIQRVVIGAIDLNPIHQGRALVELRNHGVDTATGVLEAECARLNAGFNRWIQTGRPWVIVKVAQSLDGYLTRPPGEIPWLTNERSRRVVHRLRETADAILVGANTVRRDDPALTVRHRSEHQPWRVIVTRSGRLPASAQVFTDSHRERTLVFHDVNWMDLLAELGKREITRILVEAGGNITGQLLDLDLVDEVWCFFAPLLTGGDTPSFGGLGAADNDQVRVLREPRFLRFGSDLLMVGLVHDGQQRGLPCH
jgi:diaminohydroxyphosphoribosylaminopyrimidine deaminase/5-amino-6-(5-phosphoribosylamino)uracil reductase